MIFGTPLHHYYEASVEVTSLLSTEVVEEIDGRLAVTDVDATGQRNVKFWIDGPYDSPEEEQAVQHATEEPDMGWTPREPPVSIPTFPRPHAAEHFREHSGAIP